MPVFLFSVLLFATIVYSQGTCYAENGGVASDDTPCSSADGIQCCGDGFYCLSNGLCSLRAIPRDSIKAPALIDPMSRSYAPVYVADQTKEVVLKTSLSLFSQKP